MLRPSDGTVVAVAAADNVPTAVNTGQQQEQEQKQPAMKMATNEGSPLPVDAIPSTGLKLIMNLYPPSSINFV